MGAYDVTADVTGSVVLIELLVDYRKGVVDSRSALVHRPFGVSSSVQGFTDAKTGNMVDAEFVAKKPCPKVYCLCGDTTQEW